MLIAVHHAARRSPPPAAARLAGRHPAQASGPCRANPADARPAANLCQAMVTTRTFGNADRSSPLACPNAAALAGYRGRLARSRRSPSAASSSQTSCGSAGQPPAIQQFGFCTATCSRSSKNSSRTPTKSTNVLRLGLYRLPIGEFSLLRSLAPILASFAGATEVECDRGILPTGLTTDPQTT